jgi:hypothetical protein
MNAIHKQMVLVVLVLVWVQTERCLAVGKPCIVPAGKIQQRESSGRILAKSTLLYDNFFGANALKLWVPRILAHALANL